MLGQRRERAVKTLEVSARAITPQVLKTNAFNSESAA
jgi:hypothetical protein